MTVAELIKLENEQVALLRSRSAAGDNEASAVLLEHLRAVSKAIQDWKAKKESSEKESK